MGFSCTAQRRPEATLHRKTSIIHELRGQCTAMSILSNMRSERCDRRGYGIVSSPSGIRRSLHTLVSLSSWTESWLRMLLHQSQQGEEELHALRRAERSQASEQARSHSLVLLWRGTAPAIHSPPPLHPLVYAVNS